MAGLNNMFMGVHSKTGAARPRLLRRDTGPYLSRTVTEIIYIKERKRGNIAVEIESWKRVCDNNRVDKEEGFGLYPV